MYVFKEGALVSWRGQVVPVVKRWVQREGAVYLVHTRGKDRELVSNMLIFGQLVSEIDGFVAAFRKVEPNQRIRAKYAVVQDVGYL